MLKLPVNEIFPSIQGEGRFMGIPATFIRLSGCNLKCSFCDTEHESCVRLTIDEILKEVKYQNVVITGGEPLIHEDLYHLIYALRGKDFKICLETNGTIEAHLGMDRLVDYITISPKPPNYEININLGSYIDDAFKYEFKYVVTDDFELKNIPGYVKEYYNIWLQPDSNNMKESMKKCYKLVMESFRPYRKKHIRAGIQLHKIYEVD